MYVDIDAMPAALRDSILCPDEVVDLVPWTTIEPYFKERTE